MVLHLYGRVRNRYRTWYLLNIFPKIAFSSASRTLEDIGKLCEGGFLEEAIDIAESVHEKGVHISRNSAYCLVHECEKRNDLEHGRRVQSLMLHAGLCTISVLGDHLIRLFSCHELLVEANESFRRITKPSEHTWAAIIWANTRLGQRALELYHGMQLSGVKSNKHIYVAVLKACTMTKAHMQGKIIHGQIIQIGEQSDIFIANTLVDMYAKCGDLMQAYIIFDTLINRNVVSWNAMVTAYIQQGKCLLAQEILSNMQAEGIELNTVSWAAMIVGFIEHGNTFLALESFGRLKQEGFEADDVIFLTVLKACSSIVMLEQGRYLHEQILATVLQESFKVQNALIDMYAKCGSLDEACHVFDRLPYRNQVSWGAIIAGYSQHDEGQKALECFQMMQRERILLDEVIFSSIIKACASLGALEQGRLIHEQMMEDGLQSDIVGNALTNMYTKCGTMEEACATFDKLPTRDVMSWNAMISSYIQNGDCFMALEAFQKMQQEGIRPNLVTFLSTIKACATIGEIDQGKHIHNIIIKHGFQSDPAIGSALLDMYTKCGSLGEAHNIFGTLLKHDVVSWGAMIAGYAHHGKAVLALECLEKMLEEGIKPNEVSFLSILIACSRVGLVDEGCRYFQRMQDCYDIIPNTSHCTSMVDLLGRAGFLIEAKKLLQATIQPNITGWTSLLNACRMHENAGLAQHCFNETALNFCSATESILSSAISCNLQSG